MSVQLAPFGVFPVLGTDERELREFARTNTPCGAPVDRPQSRWGSGE